MREGSLTMLTQRKLSNVQLLVRRLGGDVRVPAKSDIVTLSPIPTVN